MKSTRANVFIFKALDFTKLRMRIKCEGGHRWKMDGNEPI